jgi:hypothetical protein
MSFAVPLDNRTPFSAESFVIPDLDAQEVLLIIMVASFESPNGGSLRLAVEQSPVCPSDVFHGDPAMSSTHYESDIALIKPYVDVLLNGSAYAPLDREINKTTVGMAVGDIKKTLHVSGERVWAAGAPIKPLPFTKMPIVYERAFGGMTKGGDLDLRNPVGIGFKGAVSFDESIMTEVPNIEYPDQLIESKTNKPKPAGFGAIGRYWKPRCDFAGTYDQKWLDERFPLAPKDFDIRHYQAAPLDQQSKTIRGGEDVLILNMTPNEKWRFRLPKLNVPVHLLYEDIKNIPMDTVLFEPDNYRVRMTSRLAIRIIRNSGELREVVLGHLRPGFLKARAKRKLYIDYSGVDGTDPAQATYFL